MNPQSRWLVPPAIVLSVGVAHAEQYMSVAEAQAVMFPGQRLTAEDVTLTPDQVRAIEKVSGIRVRVKSVRAWRAANGGVLFLDQVIGKHEYITWALAVNGDGTVRDIEILDYRETYGAEIRNANWRAQFVGKTHGAELKLNRDIKNISGATLSCRHVTDGVKRLLATYEVAFKR
jgi:Na+-transporting NADH:ubiquinone oxidoreductase subunit NqrC